MPQTLMTGAAWIAKDLARMEIDTLFGVMGDGNVDLIAAAVERHAIRYFSARHEQGALSMAEGFAHATGTIGVATVTYGPGATNTVTAMTSAARHRARVLLIGGHRTGRHGPPQLHDPDALFRPTGAVVLRIDRATEMPGAVARALDLVAQTGGPVVLSIADVLLEGPTTWHDHAEPESRKTAQTAPVPVAPEDVQAIADLLIQAERPLILAGRGAREDGAGPLIIALAERCGAALMTSLLGHGLFGDHPNALGISGGLALPDGQQAMQAADAVLVLGAGLNGWTCAAGDAFANARIIQVDSDPTAIDRVFRAPDLTITGGVAVTCAAVLHALPQHPRKHSSWQDAHPHETPLPMMTNGRLDPDALARALDGALPRSRALALDGGHFFEALCREIKVYDPRAFFWTLGFGAVGLGLATAIGAAVARPDRVTVAGIGDGGLLMSLPELETVARLGLPILVLVMNDASYGAEEKLLLNKGWAPELARFPQTDFAALGRSLGIESETLAVEADIQAILPRLKTLNAPLLLDARIDQSRDAGFVELLHRLKRASG